MKEIISNLVNFSSPINLNYGITINAYPLNKDFNELIKEYTNLTFVDIGDCTNLILDYYNLEDRNQIYIIGYDTPSNNSLSSINNFNYDIYLLNGTQVDLNICKDIKIKITSKIKNPARVKLDDGLKFLSQGYDIYNKSDFFIQIYVLGFLIMEMISFYQIERKIFSLIYHYVMTIVNIQVLIMIVKDLFVNVI